VILGGWAHYPNTQIGMGDELSDDLSLFLQLELGCGQVEIVIDYYQIARML
jgi:hypothetical protein